MKRSSIFVMIALLGLLTACGDKEGGNKAKDKSNETVVNADPMQNKGIGPIKELILPATIDEELAKTGEANYVVKCSACHKANKKYIGPAPAGIMERRTPEWIMNMILNPEGMIAEDPIAKQLLIEYNGAPMANQNLTEEEARSILEYFRTLK